jgi:hypothetical protein
MKCVALFLMAAALSFGNACVSTAAISTASNLATTWTSCGGTTPQPADTVTIVSLVVLKASFPVTNITLNNSAASLTTDGLGPYSVTTSDNTTCIHVTLGMEYPTGYAIDTLSASFGNEVTFACPGSGTSLGGIDQHGNASFRLWHCIFQGGSTGIPLGFTGDTGSAIDVQNSKFVGGVIGISIYFGSGAGGPLSLTINNVSSTGLGAGPFLNMYYSIPSSSCSISNVTILGPASSAAANAMFYALDDISICAFTGNALETDAGGTYSTTFIGGTAVTPSHSQVLSYNLGKSFYPAQAGSGFGGNGSATHHSSLQNNILDGFSQNFAFGTGTYVDLSGNICIARAAVGSEQGCYFGFGATNITSTNDISTSPQGAQGNINTFYIGNGASIFGSATITLHTCISSLASIANAGCINLGEGNGGSGGQVINPSSISKSIAYGGGYGIASGNALDVFLTSGTGGVGVWQNSVFGAVVAPYQKYSGSTNFDNGVTAHPSATYGDLALDPKVVNPYRSWPDCDAILGGPGTTLNLFTQLFNRWNGTAAAGYTPQAIYNCMRAAYAPRDIRLAGTGAVKPILIFTATQ